MFNVRDVLSPRCTVSNVRQMCRNRSNTLGSRELFDLLIFCDLSSEYVQDEVSWVK